MLCARCPKAICCWQLGREGWPWYWHFVTELKAGHLSPNRAPAAPVRQVHSYFLTAVEVCWHSKGDHCGHHQRCHDWHAQRCVHITSCIIVQQRETPRGQIKMDSTLNGFSKCRQMRGSCKGCAAVAWQQRKAQPVVWSLLLLLFLLFVPCV